MSESPITITYSLEAVLSRLETKIDKQGEKLDNLQKDVGNLTVSVARLEEGQKGLEKRMESLETRLGGVEIEQKSLTKELSDLKGFKSLVIPVLIAIITASLTLLGRFIPTP